MFQRTIRITNARPTVVVQKVRHALVRTCHIETVLPKLPGTVEALLLYKLTNQSCSWNRITHRQQLIDTRHIHLSNALQNWSSSSTKVNRQPSLHLMYIYI